MERVVIKLPSENIPFARAATRHSLEKGNAPFSSPLLYLDVLDPDNLEHQELARRSTEAWAVVADKILTFSTLGDLETFLQEEAPTLNGKPMKRVLVESPYAGPTPADIEKNKKYLNSCLLECLLRGEAPFASHKIYTQPGILRDEVPAERQWGIDAGLYVGKVAEATIVYEDKGMSGGMKYGIANAEAASRPIEFRKLSKT